MQKTSRPAAPAPRPGRNGNPPKFVTGSLLRHILVMTGTGAVGLMAIFVGDLVNMVFLGMLADDAVLAAVGYASSILFFATSIGIGLSIAATSLISPALGAGLMTRARRLTVNAHLLTFAVGLAISALMFPAVPALLKLLGASGHALDLARGYLYILVPSLAPLALGMTSAAVLRSVGDAQRAMHVTLGGAIVNVVLDPIFIFWLGLGIDGAAMASFIARLAVMAIGLWGVMRVHGLMARPKLKTLLLDAPPLLGVAVPAMLTNVATPVANAYVTAAIAPFGVGAVAGWAIVGRIIPVAFGASYALSGSVGPILGQNYGARQFDRMRTTLTLSLVVMCGFTAVAWLLLALLTGPLTRMFNATGDAAMLIALFCRWLSPLFVFLGALFIANACFNTLRRPHVSTALNWARATLGTIPFVMAGAASAGAAGVLAGNMLGGVPFGLVSVWMCYRLIAKLSEAAKAEPADPPSPSSRGEG